MNENLRVLIVENDDACRAFLCKVISNIDGTEVAAAVSNGRLAVPRLKLERADLVLLQMEAPAAEGPKTLEKLRECHPEAGVIAIGKYGSEDADDSAKAAKMGVLDFISGIGEDLNESVALSLRRRLMTLIGLYRARRNAKMAKQLREEHAPAPKPDAGRVPHPRVRRPETPFRPPPQPVRHPAPKIAVNHKIELLAIGISTGGPNALAQLIPLLPADLGIPLLIVQHMPAVLTASLAESLNKKADIEVREAVDGEEVLPNVAYVASGGCHMTVACEPAKNGVPAKKRIRFTSDPPVNSCRPSVDVLFRSIAAAYDGMVLAVIMTGMGNDGMEGVRALKHKKCYCVSQTEETCVVYGMPRAVAEAGLSDEQVPLENIAGRILELVRGQGPGRGAK